MPSSPIQTLNTPKLEEEEDVHEAFLPCYPAQIFNPIPFSPAKILDFTTHANLFRALGLSEFAALDLSGQIRSDYLIQLFANYDLSTNLSIVGDVAIAVGREDLAMALRLPLNKKEGIYDTELDIFSKGESKKVLQEFLSTYVLLEAEHEDEILILPEEAVVANNLVKEGRAYAIDWAGLMWVLVKEELMDVFKTGRCRYASHLQFLMKFQQPYLFVKVEAIPVLDEEEGLVGMNLGSMNTFNEINVGLGTGFQHCLCGNYSNVFPNSDEFLNLEMMTSFMPIPNSGDADIVASSDGRKRHIDVNEDDVSPQQKQMRYNWEEPTLAFEPCIGEAQIAFESCIGEADMAMCKAKILYSEKEIDVQQANTEIQILSAELEYKDSVIRYYEHVIGNLKEALKEAQSRFDE